MKFSEVEKRWLVAFEFFCVFSLDGHRLGTKKDNLVLSIKPPKRLHWWLKRHKIEALFIELGSP